MSILDTPYGCNGFPKGHYHRTVGNLVVNSRLCTANHSTVCSKSFCPNQMEKVPFSKINVLRREDHKLLLPLCPRPYKQKSLPQVSPESISFGIKVLVSQGKTRRWMSQFMKSLQVTIFCITGVRTAKVFTIFFAGSHFIRTLI